MCMQYRRYDLRGPVKIINPRPRIKIYLYYKIEEQGSRANQKVRGPVRVYFLHISRTCTEYILQTKATFGKSKC
jgi:hypothetical protein